MIGIIQLLRNHQSLAFHQSQVDEWRIQATLFLLAKDNLNLAVQIRLLESTESEVLRYEILKKWNKCLAQRNSKAMTLTVQLLRTDPSSKVRTMAANLLIKFLPIDPSLLSELADAFKNATAPEWQEKMRAYLVALIGYREYSDWLLQEMQESILYPSSLIVSFRCAAFLEQMIYKPGVLGKKAFDYLCDALLHPLNSDLMRYILGSLRKASTTRLEFSMMLADLLEKSSNALIRTELIDILSKISGLPPRGKRILQKEIAFIMKYRKPGLQATGLQYLPDQSPSQK